MQKKPPKMVKNTNNKKTILTNQLTCTPIIIFSCIRVKLGWRSTRGLAVKLQMWREFIDERSANNSPDNQNQTTDFQLWLIQLTQWLANVFWLHHLFFTDCALKSAKVQLKTEWFFVKKGQLSILALWRTYWRTEKGFQSVGGLRSGSKEKERKFCETMVGWFTSSVFAQVWSSLSKFGTGFQVTLNHSVISFKSFSRKKVPRIFVTLLALIEHICLAKCGTSVRTKTKQCDRNFSFLKRKTHCNHCTSATKAHTHICMSQKCSLILR